MFNKEVWKGIHRGKFAMLGLLIPAAMYVIYRTNVQRIYGTAQPEPVDAKTLQLINRQKETIAKPSEQPIDQLHKTTGKPSEQPIDQLHKTTGKLGKEPVEKIPQLEAEPEPMKGPSLERELARYRLANNIKDLKHYITAQLKKFNSGESLSILAIIDHRYRSIQADLKRLGNSDNSEAWREKENAELQDLLRRRLHYLQNPKQCSDARKLVCDLKNKRCGFGCQLHHLLYCFMIAYGEERTMIITSKGWTYNPDGWEAVFLPLSKNCTTISTNEQIKGWESDSTINATIVSMPAEDSFKGQYHSFAESYPEDLAPRLQAFHDHPKAWFKSVFISSLMRLQPHTEKYIQSVKEKIQFKGPVVGVHVRRTDKLDKEAKYFSVEQYMEHVKKWFLLQETITGKVEERRRVYIATDDPTVIPEARKKYPDFEFYGNVSVAALSDCKTRYTKGSLMGLIADIHILASTDYLVCTFSSNVCRLAYEMMATLHSDVSTRVRSLDDPYYHSDGLHGLERALYDHKPENTKQIALNIGDVVNFHYHHRDGYDFGINTRTGIAGLYPSYKTDAIQGTIKYPVYPEVLLTKVNR